MGESRKKLHDGGGDYWAGLTAERPDVYVVGWGEGRWGQGDSGGLNSLRRQNVLADTTSARLVGRPGLTRGGMQPGNWALGRSYPETSIRHRSLEKPQPADLIAHLFFSPVHFHPLLLICLWASFIFLSCSSQLCQTLQSVCLFVFNQGIIYTI